MNCPNCDVPMIAGAVMQCATGDARQFICRKCSGKFWQQTSLAPHRENFGSRPLREIQQRLAAVAV